MTAPHPRVHHGATAQHVAHQYLITTYPTMCVTSVAPLGSHAPDIVATVGTEKIQCEVKSSFNFTSPIVTINKTAKRGHLTAIDEMVTVVTGGKWTSVEGIVDYYRLTDDTIGFPGDDGSPTSGKLPKCLKINDPTLLRSVRQSILTNLCLRQDAYFILVCKHPTIIPYIFYTGYGNNVLNAPLLPELSMAKLRTYGTARNNSMRVALKVSFILPGR